MRVAPTSALLPLLGGPRAFSASRRALQIVTGATLACSAAAMQGGRHAGLHRSQSASARRLALNARGPPSRGRVHSSERLSSVNLRSPTRKIRNP